MNRNTLLPAFIFFLTSQAFCQTHTATIEALNTIIKPITKISPEDSFEDINFIKNLIREADIIGVGESTHGTSLYNIYRQRIVRYLVQEMNYKAIIDEGDIIAAERLDAYINGKTDSLQFYGGLRPVVTNKKELDWLRKYNSTQTEKERVHIYGAEVRGFYSIVRKIKSLYPNNQDSILDRLERDAGVGYKSLSKQDFENAFAFFQLVKEKSSNHEQAFYLSLFKQQLDFAYRQRFGKNDFDVRDKYMFENIKDIVSNAMGNKAILLAHNGHVQKTKFGGLPSLGFLLNNFYKEKYFVIATDFQTGHVQVANPKSGNFENKFFGEVREKEAFENFFAKCRFPQFSLSVNDALQNSVTAEFVNSNGRMLRSISSTGDIITSSIRLAENYDLIVFFNNTDINN